MTHTHSKIFKVLIISCISVSALLSIACVLSVALEYVLPKTTISDETKPVLPFDFSGYMLIYEVENKRHVMALAAVSGAISVGLIYLLKLKTKS
jgi:hypothetical protein